MTTRLLANLVENADIQRDEVVERAAVVEECTRTLHALLLEVGPLQQGLIEAVGAHAAFLREAVEESRAGAWDDASAQRGKIEATTSALQDRAGSLKAVALRLVDAIEKARHAAQGSADAGRQAATLHAQEEST